VYLTQQEHRFWCVNIFLLYNDLIVNIYTIGLGTSFYNLLVPLHTNTLITQIKQIKWQQMYRQHQL